MESESLSVTLTTNHYVRKPAQVKQQLSLIGSTNNRVRSTDQKFDRDALAHASHVGTRFQLVSTGIYTKTRSRVSYDYKRTYSIISRALLQVKRSKYDWGDS